MSSHPTLEKIDPENLKHRLRAPLTTVKGCLEIVAQRWNELSDEDRQTLLDSALHQADNLALVIAGIGPSDGRSALAGIDDYERRLQIEVARSSRYDAPLTLALISIDDMAAMTGTIAQVGRSLHSGRNSDDYFRLGEASFAILMPNTSRAGAESALDRLMDRLAEVRSHDHDVTFSYGIAEAASKDALVLHEEAAAALMRSQLSPSCL
ncbi:MAG: diguanylate cyclase [Actinomycetota bacterium]|nr:diguanylate cyclase [Actinomycetota bacterium]